MGQAERVNVRAIHQQIASPDAETRGRAVNALLIALHRQPDLREPARDIFYNVAANETYAWAVINAVIGIERLDGPDASRPYWRKLLTQTDGIAAHRVALSCVNPAHVSMMLELIDQRPERAFQAAAISALGRMRDPIAIPTLLRYGDNYEFEPAVVQALSELGDPSVIPWLQRLVGNDRHVSQFDERGATWTLGEIAAMAIHTLERNRPQPAEPATVPPSPAHQQTTAPAAPPPLPGVTPTANRSTIPASIRTLRSILHPSLIPLVAAGVEVAGLVFLFALYLFIAGDQKPPAISDRFVDAIALPVPLFGLVAGLTVFLAGRTPRPWHKIVAGMGGLACAGFVYGFGFDFLTR